MTSKGPEAAPSGSDAVFVSSVDRLVEGLHGLELGSTFTGGQVEVATPGDWSRPQSRNRCNTEKGENAAVTPSRLACLKQLREELTCAVCIDICVRPVTTPCGHNYCRSCLRRSLQLRKPRCPKCRADLPPGTTLHINTSLWITIQHLFPADAGAKPLTPPAPTLAQPQQHLIGPQPSNRGASGRRATAHDGNIAAPFRPPRFVPAAVPTRSFFTGHSLSRANAAAAGLAEMGMVSPSGRSTSGPRLQRSTSGQSNSVTALGDVPPGWQGSGHRHGVFSLAELGVRPGRGVGAVAMTAQRDRRRSRSAERWDGSGSGRSLLASTDDLNDAEGPVPTAAVRPSATMLVPPPPAGAAVRLSAQPQTVLPAPSSRLMALLSGPQPRNVAAAGVHGSRHHAPIEVHRLGSERSVATAIGSSASSLRDASQAGSNGRSQGNPFLRERRPPQPSQPATATAARAVQLPAGAATGAMNFTASQRAMLDKRAHTQGPSALRASSSRPAEGLGSGLAESWPRAEVAANTDADAAVAPAPRMASASSQGSGTCSMSGGFGSSRPGDSSLATIGSLSSSWSARALDEVSELELVEPEGGQLLPSRSSGGGSGAGSCSSGRVGGESVPILGRLAATSRFVAPVQVGSSSTAGLQGLPPRQRRMVRVGADDSGDNDDRIEILDELQPQTGSLQATSLSSPIWSRLADHAARTVEPLTISQPSLPRLRLTPRHGCASAAAPPGPAQQNPPLEAAAAGAAQTAVAAAAGMSITSAHQCEAGEGRSWGGKLQRHMDPDLASNYDGENPADADTFFSSPFFDRKLLQETLEETTAGTGRGGSPGSEAGFSPHWAEAVAAAVEAAGGNYGLALHEWHQEDWGGSGAGDGLPHLLDEAAAAAGRCVHAGCSLQLVPGYGSGGLSEDGCEGTVGLPGATELAMETSAWTGAVAPAELGLQAGDRECPIELLSDSDEDDGELGTRPWVMGEDSQCTGSLQAAAAVLSKGVVSGLRWPRRT